MPVAAIPKYLPKDLEGLSPGLRFSVFLPIWTDRSDQEKEVHDRAAKKSAEGADVNAMLRRDGMDATIRKLQASESRPLAALWDKNDFASRHAWSKIVELSKDDKALCEALLNRQQQAFELAGPNEGRFSLGALAVAPFTTGLGNEHPLENGFAFLNPYGLPYLPGSGVKGVLRQAARELASGEWGDACGWTDACIHELEVNESQRIDLSSIDVLFGRESAFGETQLVRGVLTFWDVIPQIAGNSLAVDIMTPHQSHYYQQKPDQKSGSTSPNESGDPNPISFLTVPPRSGFTFHVCCDLARLASLAPDMAHDGRWKDMLTSAFAHAFSWLGFGAKTSVGYGAMQDDPQAAEREEAKKREKARKAQQAREESARRAELDAMSPTDRAIQEYLDNRQDKNQSELSALFGGLKNNQWSGEVKLVAARRAKSMMQTVDKWKETSGKKNPQKDYDYQDTLKVMGWLKGD